ncbi:MAG: gliding motility-associated C-terminal domain-containing protein [Bacteroidales bacterium]|nr:gliding motility-associated C-terminal domain-containing protein [Bacteroidales bacterium]
MDISKSLNVFAINLKTVAVALFFSVNLYSFAQSIEQQVVKIKYIALNSGNIEIEWEKLPTPDITHYTISYLKFTGNNPIPSFNPVEGISVNASATPFASFSPDLLAGVDIHNQPVVFAVQAHAGIQKSNSDNENWDSTIVLKASFDSCQGTASLSWNRYDFNMWDYNLLAYRIYLSENNSPYILYRTVYTEQYTIEGLRPNTDYSVFIAAIPDNNSLGADSATSFSIGFNTRMERVPEYIYADFATFSNGNALVQFSVDPLGEISRFNLLRASLVDRVFETIAQLNATNNKISFTDKSDFLSGPYLYSVDAINTCNIIARSSENTASTIILEANITEQGPLLTWNEYIEWPGGVANYIIERRLDNNNYQILQSVVSAPFTDTELKTLTGQGLQSGVCYRITAVEGFPGENSAHTSTTNEVCIEMPLNIRFDFDAFIPGSATGNNSFGPAIDYLPDEFIFEILDRSGRIVYRSTDPLNCRWDGKINNRPAPEGAYMYVLQYSIQGGRKHVIRGSVAVVYP